MIVIYLIMELAERRRVCRGEKYGKRIYVGLGLYKK